MVMGVCSNDPAALGECLPIVHLMSLVPLGRDVEKGFDNDGSMHPKLLSLPSNHLRSKRTPEIQLHRVANAFYV